MRKLLAVLAVALILVSVPVAISIQVPRQVDPSSAPTDQVYGQGLYLFYGSIVDALSGGNFTAARQLLAHASFVHIPPEIADAYDSFNGLINSTATTFQAADRQLANASGSVASGRIAEARTFLQRAIGNLRGANQSLAQLFGAEPQLAALTGIPSSLLLQKIQPLETIYRTYSAEADHLLKVITGLTKLSQPAVTLQVPATTIASGSNVTFSGRLADPSGAALPSRTVTIYFGDGAIGSATTDALGEYAGSLGTPYYYQPTASVFASFVPAGNDSLVYSPAASASVALNVTFSTPTVSVEAPQEAYAGQPLTLTGSLTLQGRPLSDYQVSLSGFQTSSLAPPPGTSALTSQGGGFSLELTVPASLAQGTYPLTLRTGADREVGPAAATVRVQVVKEDPVVASSVPVVAFAGFPVTVSGTVTANGSGLAGARVLNVTPSPSVNATTYQGGSFSFTVTPPLSTSNGDWSYTVEVYPTQSWISPAPVNVTVFVVNPFVLAVPLSSLGALAFVVRRRRGPAPGRVTVPQARKAPPPVAPARVPLTGLPAIYADAVKLVEEATSVVLHPQTTINEYLVQVRGRLKGVKHFEYISGALESHLYGPGVFREVEGWALAELKSLREELEG